MGDHNIKAIKIYFLNSVRLYTLIYGIKLEI